MTHFDKQFKRLFLAIAALILFIPLFGSSVANSLFSDGQGMASAAKKSDKFDVNKVVKATVVYSKHVPILKVTVKPTITNAFAKKDQLKFEFDKKNVDLKNMQASVEKNLPFKHTTKKDTALLLTFEKDVKSGTYKQAYAIPTKKLSKITKIKATYNGQKIKITNNKIKSGKYAQKQADTASKKDQSDFKNKSTSTANKSRDSQSADNNSSNHTTGARENSYPVKAGAVSDTQSAVAPQVSGQYSNDRSATSTSQEAYGHTTTISHYGDATANTSNNYASNGSQKTNWTATTSQTNNKDYGRGTGANVTCRPVSYNSGVNRSGNGVSNKNTSRHNDKKAARSNSQKSSKSTVKTKKTETGKKTTSDKTKASDSKKTTNKDSNDNQKTSNKNNKSDSTVDKAGDSSQKNDDGASNNASQSSNTNSNADSNDQTTPTSPTTDNNQTPAVGEDNTNSQESSTVDSSGNTDNTQNGSQTTSDSHSATTTNTNATSTSSDDGSSNQTQASSTTNDQQSTQDQSATQTMTASTTGTATAGSNSVSTAVAA